MSSPHFLDFSLVYSSAVRQPSRFTYPLPSLHSRFSKGANLFHCVWKSPV
jgi:hypothetical protein